MAEAIFGLILAGGQGRRMGGTDKALTLLGDRPLLAHVAARIGPQVARLGVSANGDPLRFAPMPVIADLPDGQGEGPFAGLLAGLAWAKAGGATALLSVPVDAPFLPTDLRARLAGPGPAIAVSHGRDHPTVGLWPIAEQPRLAALFATGERRMRMAAQDARRVDFADDPDPFTNLNTPEDLARAAAALNEGAR